MAGAKLGPGTLYGAIARLEQRGLIQPLETDNRRQPYRLTGSARRPTSTSSSPPCRTSLRRGCGGWRR